MSTVPPEINRWVVLPISGGLWVCRDDMGMMKPEFPLTLETEDDAILEKREVPGVQDVAVSSTSSYAAVRSQGGKALHVYRLEEETGTPVHIALPRDMERVRSAAFYGDRLFVGGQPQTNPATRLGFFDLTQNKPRFTPLDLPDSLGIVNKPVVKVVVSGDKLYAIDTSFTPKLALVYDVTRDDPELLIQTRIPSGVDDNVLDMAVGRSYAAVLSETRSKEGKAWKIGVFDSHTFDEIATFFHRVQWSDTLAVPSQIEAMDDVFLLAHGLEGLGVARLQDSEPTLFQKYYPIQPWSHPYLPLHRIKYVQPLGPGRVIGLQPNSISGSVFCVIKRGSYLWWEEIKL